MTWVVATIIILFVIIIFIYASKVLADKKNLKFSSGTNLVVQSAVVEESLLSLLQTEINGKSIQQIFIDDEFGKNANDIFSLLKKIPNCFRYNRGGSWVLTHYSNKSKVLGKIGDFSASGKRYKNYKFNSVIYLDAKSIQLNEVCNVPGIGII